MTAHHEVERTWEPPPECDVPDLSGVAGVRRVGTPRVVDLEAVYFDTEDLSLLRSGVTLRRRTGGDDAGWHLKIPAGDGRDEVQVPLGRARHTPPKALREAVTVWTRGAPLTVLGTITTNRTTHDLLGADGAVLAALADDRVVGSSRLDPDQATWREWEVELVTGAPELLDTIGDHLAAQGVPPSPTQRKLSRVLGDHAPLPPKPARLGKRKPAGRVLQRRLVRLTAELARRDSEIHRQVPDAVHQARVTIRRLRSALATFRPLVDPEVTEPLRAELGWLGRSLGVARDQEVVRERLERLVDEEPPELVLGPVRDRLERWCSEVAGAADAEMGTVLASARYFRLLAALDELGEDPPWTAAADEAARDVLRRQVRRDWKRLRRRVAAAAAADADQHDAARHEVRKAAKRLRYGSETLVPLWGRDADRLARAAASVQSVLGDRQDTVVSRRDLMVLGAEAADAGESAFTYGRLHAREEARAASLDEEFDTVWGRASRPGLRDWLS